MTTKDKKPIPPKYTESITDFNVDVRQFYLLGITVGIIPFCILVLGHLMLMLYSTFILSATLITYMHLLEEQVIIENLIKKQDRSLE